MDILQEKLQLLYKAISVSSDAVGILNLDGELLYSNPALKLLINSNENFKEKYRQSFIQKNRELAISFFQNIWNWDSWSQVISNTDQSDGKKRSYILTVNAFENEENQISWYICILKEITKCKSELHNLKKEKASLEIEINEKTNELLESNKFLRKKITEIETLNEQLIQMNDLFKENSKLFVSGPVIVFKRLNKENWPVEYVSENVEEILGYSCHEMRNTDLYYNCIHPEDVQGLYELAERNILNTDKQSSEKKYRLKKKNGEYVSVIDYTTYVRNPKWEVTSFIGYIINIW